jgi:hypothetical protein
MLPLENLLRYGVMALWVKRMPAPLRYSVMAFNRRWSITPWGGDTAGPSPRSSGLRGDVRATPALCEVGVRLMKVLREKVHCRSSISIHIDCNQPLVGGRCVHSTALPPRRQIDYLFVHGEGSKKGQAADELPARGGPVTYPMERDPPSRVD